MICTYVANPYTTHLIAAGVDFTPSRYNATFITGATTANTSIPIITGGSDEDDKQFSLRLFIDGAAYQQCVFSGNISTATVFVTPGIDILILQNIHTYLRSQFIKATYTKWSSKHP